MQQNPLLQQTPTNPFSFNLVVGRPASLACYVNKVGVELDRIVDEWNIERSLAESGHTRCATLRCSVRICLLGGRIEGPFFRASMVAGR